MRKMARTWQCKINSNNNFVRKIDVNFKFKFCGQFGVKFFVKSLKSYLSIETMTETTQFLAEMIKALKARQKNAMEDIA